MGIEWPWGNKSKSEVDALIKTISDIVVTNTQHCQQNISQTQNVVDINQGFKFWSKITLKQSSTIKANCVQDAKFQAKLQNDIINAIANSSTASGVALLGAFDNNKSDAKTKLSTIVQNSVTANNILENYSSIENTQNYTGVNEFIILFQNVEAIQGAELYAAATLKTLADVGIFNTIKTHIDNSADSESKNPLDPLADMLKMTSMMLMIIIAIIIIAALIGGVMILRDPNASKNLQGIISTSKSKI